MDSKNRLIKLCNSVINGKYSSSEFMSYLETAIIEDERIQKLVDDIIYRLELDVYSVFDEEQFCRRKKYAEAILDSIQ